MRKKLFIFLALLSLCITAHSENWNLVWREDFGVAEDTVVKDFPDPTMTVPGHTVVGECDGLHDGRYGIANSTWWAFVHKKSCGKADARHFTAGGDHTRNPNGAMLIVNVGGAGNGEVIYEQTMQFETCGNHDYRFTIFGASVSFSSSLTLLLSNLTLNIVNIKDPDNPVIIKSMDTGDLPLWKFNNYNNNNPNGMYTHAMKEWKQFDLEFTAKDGDILKLQVLNNCMSGGGNDFVLDDISLYRKDDEEVVEPIIKIGHSYRGDPVNNQCILRTQYTISNNVLESWEKIYDFTYFLWQESEDDGLTWKNIPQGGGGKKMSVDVDNDPNHPKVYRLVTTGGKTMEEAQKEAEYIGAHNGPSNGCQYYSISNTLTSNVDIEEESCEYNEKLMRIFSEEFGTIDSSQTRDFEGMAAGYKRFDTLQSEAFIEGKYYAVTCAPDAALFNTSDGKRVYSESHQSLGATKKANDAHLVVAIPSLGSNQLLIDKVIPANKLCHCRQNLFNIGVNLIDAPAATASFTVALEDESGKTISKNSSRIGASTNYTLLSLPFSLNDDKTKEVHLKIYATTLGAALVAFDNLSITSCGEYVDIAEVGIDNKKTTKYLAANDCNDAEETHTVTLFAEDWFANYPVEEFAWQKSTDGIHWETIPGKEKSITHQATSGMTLYRAIVGPDKPTVDEIARDGYPLDPCRKYYITDPVTISCEEKACETPSFTIDSIPSLVCKGTDVTLKANVELLPTYQFEWKRNEETLSTTELSLTDKPSDSTFYEFRITDRNCPPAIFIDTVVTVDVDTITLTLQTDSLCEGGEVILEAVRKNHHAPLIWEYSTDSMRTFTAFDPYEDEEVLHPTQSTYYRNRCDSFICPAIVSDTVFAYVEKKVDVKIDQLPEWTCDGVEVDLNAYVDLDPNDNTYTWVVNGDTLWDHQKLEYKEVPLVRTTYQFLVFGKHCPVSFDTTYTRIMTEHGIEIFIDKDTICEGETVRVTAEYDYNATVVWQYTYDNKKFFDYEPDEVPNDLIYRPNETPKIRPTANLTPDTTTYYRVLVPESNRCPQTFSFSVIAHVEKKAKNVAIEEIPSIVCKGVDLELTGHADIDPTINTLSWIKNKDTLSKGELVTVDAPTQATYYEFNVAGKYCPDIKKSANVNVESSGNVWLEIDKDSICEGEIAQITVGYEETSNDIIWEKSQDNENFKEFDPNKDIKALMPTYTTYYRIKSAAKTSTCPTIYSNTVQVNVETKVKVEVDPVPPLVCVGREVELHAKAYLEDYNSFTWSKGEEVISSTKLDVKDNPTEETLYKLTILGKKCPAIVKEFNVALEEEPQLELSLSAQGVCEGDEITLTAGQTNVKGIQWQKKTAGESEFTTISEKLTDALTLVADKNTTYRLVSSGEEVCPSTTSEEIKVSVEPKITFTLPEKVAICSNEKVDVNVLFEGEPSSVAWFEKGKEDSDYRDMKISSTSFSILPSETTEYRMVYTAQHCPSDTGYFTAVVDDGVTIAEIPNDTICGGEPVTLKTSCENASSLIWEAVEEEESNYHKIGEGIEEMKVTPKKSTKYKLTAESVNGCPSQPVYTSVIVYDPVHISMNEAEICEGDSVTLYLSGLNHYTEITWSTDEFETSIGSKPTLKVSPDKTTRYSARVVNGVCNDETYGTVEVYDYPKVLACTEYNMTSYKLEVESDRYPLYYNFGEGREVTTSNILEKATYGTVYHVTIANELGCSTEYEFETPLYDIQIPEYFVADRDRWKVENLERFPRSSYKIYDRFGKLVFEGVSDDEGWDGLYNGHAMPSTDYWYVLNMPEIDRQFSGHFTLIRESGR